MYEIQSNIQIKVIYVQPRDVVKPGLPIHTTTICHKIVSDNY